MQANRQPPVLAIDGPSGAGKGTISHRAAERLGFHLLDSGAVYRVLAFAARRAALEVDDEQGLVKLAGELDLVFRTGAGDPPVYPLLDGLDVGTEVRGEECGRDASHLAAIPAVRAALLVCQRDFRRAPGLVADGRDMGTVVFPDAEVKIFLTARPEERAQRRHKQLIAKGISANLAHLLGDINERDRRDRERRVSPLQPAEDAIVIDTTGMDIESVLSRVLDGAAARGLVFA